MINCPVCQSQLNDNVSRCPKCGYDLEFDREHPRNPEERKSGPDLHPAKKTGKIPRAALACLVLAVVAGSAGILTWNKMGKGAEPENLSFAGSAEEMNQKTSVQSGDAVTQTDGAHADGAHTDHTDIESEKNLTVDNYTVIKELGILDRPPISVNEQIWILEKDGTYSFMDPSGDIVSEYSTSSLQLVPREYLTACLPDADGQAAVHNQWPAGEEGKVSQCTGFGGTGPWMEIVLSADGRPVISEASAQSFADWEEIARSSRGPSSVQYAEERIPKVPVYLKREGDTGEEYYIWNPVNDAVYGPYQQENHAGAGAELILDPSVDYVAGWTFFVHEPGDWYQTRVNSPFWVRQPDGQYSLWSADGRTVLENVNSVRISDLESIAFRQDNRLFVLDGNLSLQYVGPFEDGGTLIQDRAPVLADGTWKLIQFTDHQGTEAEKNSLYERVRNLQPESENLYVIHRS